MAGLRFNKNENSLSGGAFRLRFRFSIEINNML